MSGWHRAVRSSHSSTHGATMFNNLLESSAAHERNIGGQVFSFMFHTAAITAAVLATHRVVTAKTIEEHHNLTYIAKPEIARPPERPLPPKTQTQAPTPKGFQILVAPIEIPDVLPPIDLSRRITDERDYYQTRGVPGGRADGDSTIT